MAAPNPALSKAQALIGAGRVDEARSVLERAVQRAAADSELHSALCYVLVHMRAFDEAASHGRKALDFAPRVKGAAAFVLNVARLLMSARAAADAVRAFEAVLEHDPQNLDAVLGLGGAHLAMGSPLGYESACRRGLASRPDHPQLTIHLAAALSKLGRVQEAYDALARASRAHPEHQPLAMETAFHANYPSGLTREEIFEAHRRFGAVATARTKPMTHRSKAADAAAPLRRVGVLSPDLREHSCSYYAMPMVESLSREGLEVFIYHTHGTSDARTAGFKSLSRGWCDAASMDDEALAQRIFLDGVQVLIELSGLTGGARHGVLARKPAPIIATYLGYPNSTGLPTVDCRIIDSITDPPGEADALSTERLVRIDPCFLCYAPNPDAPEVSPLPALEKGFVTFGSFNAGMKFSEACLDLWAAVLRAAPGTRLFLKNFDLSLAEIESRVRQRFAERGVDPARIETLAYTASTPDHLRLYERVDLGLDTFPYHGTTTTCEAFHQGVPIVTLEGDRHASRVGSSLLRAAGLPELIAKSPEQFVEIAAGLAAEPTRLAALRASMRDRQSQGPLGDRAAFGARFAAALRDMWASRP